ncbi:SIP domain-containing protein [Citrobacter koseri]|nr:SIP domain-containing protein [Citrobacter koseri]
MSVGGVWFLPTSLGYIWMAGESAAIRKLKLHYLQDREFSRHSVSARGYWKAGEDTWKIWWERWHFATFARNPVLQCQHVATLEKRARQHPDNRQRSG